MSNSQTANYVTVCHGMDYGFTETDKLETTIVLTWMVETFYLLVYIDLGLFNGTESKTTIRSDASAMN